MFGQNLFLEILVLPDVFIASYGIAKCVREIMGKNHNDQKICQKLFLDNQQIFWYWLEDQTNTKQGAIQIPVQITIQGTMHFQIFSIKT